MRIREFDIIKGFAMSIVVFAHAVFFNFDKLDKLSQNSIMVLSTLLAPAIAIFFFISGFLGYNSYVKRRKFTVFEVAKLKVILPPYLAWSTIYLILQGTVGQVVGVPYNFDLISVIEKYLFGEAFLPFYYVIMLLIFYLLTPFLSNLTQKEMKFWMYVLFVGGLVSASLYFLPQYFGKQYVPPLLAYRNPFAWIFFYVWGMYRAKTKDILWRIRPSMWMMIGFFATYALASLEMISVPKLNKDWESYLVLGPGIYVFYFFAINIFLWISYKISLKFGRISTILSKLGENSFGIYLSHGFVLMGALGIFVLLDGRFLEESNLLFNSVGGISGIFVCYELSAFLRKMPKVVYQTLG